MSRRKQPNPAKLEDAEIKEEKVSLDENGEITGINLGDVELNEGDQISGSIVITDEFGSSFSGGEVNIVVKVANIDNDTDDQDSLGSVGTNQGSWDSNSPERASPVSSSCPTPSSVVSDTTDAGDGFTVGVTESTPYACRVCNRAFARSSLLSKHEQSHVEQLQYHCTYCPRLFKHKRSRDRHIKLHTGDKKYKCSYCEAAFSRSDHLKIHLKTHDNSKPFKCFLCNRGYNTAAALTSHQQSHVKIETRSPGRIKEEGEERGSTESHQCEHCSETFSTLELLQLHVSCHHFDFATDNMVDNVATNSAADNAKWLCMYCSKDFLSMEELQQHVSSSHDLFDSKGDDSSSKSLEMKEVQRVSYPCYNCTMQFYCPEKLREHVARVHLGSTTQQKLFSGSTSKDCNVCLPTSPSGSMTMTQPSNDLSIQLTPTDLTWKRKAEMTDGSGSCKRFLQKSDVQQGCEANDKEKSEWPIYICNICGTQLPTFSSFMIHMDNHMPGNSHNSNTFLGYCPLCGEACRDQMEVNNHVLFHAISLKLGKCCGICKKVFSYHSDDLQKHLLETHTSTTYKCSICDETFELKSDVLMHMTKNHSNECQHYRCKFCPNQIFHDRLDAEIHITQHAPQIFNSLCRNRLAYPIYSDHETELQKKAKNLQCPLCHKCFQTEHFQYLHIVREHKNVRDIYSKRLLELADMQRQIPSSSPSSSGLNSVPSSEHLPKFELSHTDRYTCDICDSGDFSNESDLAAHKKLHQSKSKPVSVSLHCAYCNELCKSRTDLENHTKSHQINSAKGKHKCNICDEIFSSGMTLAEHKLSHCKIVSGNACTHCKTILSDEQAFYGHQLQHSTVINKQNSQISLPANCIVCCQTLQSEVEIKLHANFHLRHLLNKELMCNICKKVCDTSNGSLVATTGSDNSKVYICNDCFNKSSSSSTSSSPLFSLIKYENDEKGGHTCPHCHQVFQNEEKAMKHLASHGVFDVGSSYMCHLCRSLFPTALKLQVHVIEHNFFGSGQFRCYICSTVFTTASGLLAHMLKHGSNAKPYECSQCQMKFFFQTELDNHRDEHVISMHQKNYQVSRPPSHEQPGDGSSFSVDTNKRKQLMCQCCEFPWSPSSLDKHFNHCPLKSIKKESSLPSPNAHDVDVRSENGDEKSRASPENEPMDR